MTAHKYDEKPQVVFSPDAQRFLKNAPDTKLSILCGRNNGGKSFILKTLAEQIGVTASYLGPARYQNFNVLTPYLPDRRGQKRSTKKFEEFLRQWRNEQQNIDNSPLNLPEAIASLSNTKRAQLIEIVQDLLGATMEIKHTVEDNSMSNQYIAIDGHNMSFTSSGVRLITSLMTSLLDDEYEVFLVDEPELGISPEVQGVIADFLLDDESRKKYFGHVKSLILATHSTIFLDRTDAKNNYFVEKKDDLISMTQAQSVSEINKMHFFLMGNRLEHLYLPSAIVIVEGKTDHKYIQRSLICRFPDNQISVVAANTDNRVKEVLNTAKSLLGDIQKSPFRDRLFTVLDKIHVKGLAASLEKMGLAKDQIIVWDENGIEYYYPEKILKKIYGASGPIKIIGDSVVINGIAKTKNDLADEVVARVDPDTEYPDEFESKFLKKIDAVVTFK